MAASVAEPPSSRILIGHAVSCVLMCPVRSALGLLLLFLFFFGTGDGLRHLHVGSNCSTY